MKTFSLLVPALCLVASCSTFVPILGSNRGWQDASAIKVLEDVTVSGLRIRVTQSNEKGVCTKGQHHTIEIDGPINKDTSFALDKILARLPDCASESGSRFLPTVYMNSPGGTLQDGYAIGAVFRKRGVATRVTDRQVCASACAVAFLGGRFREVSFDGKLVFHAPYRRGIFGEPVCLNRNEAEAQVLKSYYFTMLGTSADRLYERTMDYCSDYEGWTVNAGAAKLFGLLT